MEMHFCNDCEQPIPEGPFVKVSDDEVIRAHVACRPEGVVVSQVIHFTGVNPEWVQKGTVNEVRRTPEPDYIHLVKEARHYEDHMFCGLVDEWFYGAQEVVRRLVYKAFQSGVLWTETGSTAPA
jgi:hypothetical protein